MRFTMSCAGETIPSHHQPNLPDPKRKRTHRSRTNPIAPGQPGASACAGQNSVHELNATTSGATSNRSAVAKRITEFSPRLRRTQVNPTDEFG